MKTKLPRELGWLALPAWMLPELVFAGLFLYALWVEWCLT
jgi:hypothetical protein